MDRLGAWFDERPLADQFRCGQHRNTAVNQGFYVEVVCLRNFLARYFTQKEQAVHPIVRL